MSIILSLKLYSYILQEISLLYKENTNENNDKVPINSLETSTNNLLIDEITTNYGYGREIWKSIICSAMIITVSGYFTTIFSSTIIAFEHLYDLSNNNVMFISTIYFISKINNSSFIYKIILNTKYIILKYIFNIIFMCYIYIIYIWII